MNTPGPLYKIAAHIPNKDSSSTLDMTNKGLFLGNGISAVLAAVLFLFPVSVSAQAGNACDLNNDGSVTKADVDLAVSMTLGLTPCTSTVVAAGVCNVVVIQRVTNAALGGGCVTGVAHSVTVNWTPSSSSNVTGYNVYRALTSGGPYTKVNSSLIVGVTYTDMSVQAGQSYYYVATAVDNSNAESVYSNQAQALVPTP